jgi:hypothetical protein
MRLRHIVFASVVLSSPLSAQDSTAAPPPYGLHVGSRVRVATAGTPGKRAGTIAALSPDTLRLLTYEAGIELQVPVSTITSLEESQGEHTRILKGLGIGTGIGVGLGAIIGYASGDDPPGFLSFTREDKAILAGGALGAVGLITGAVVGALNPREDWRPVTIPLRTARSSSPAFGIGVSFAFR